MQQKYRDKGLVCVSVNTDEERSKPNVLEFLIKRKATFPNLWLDEPFEVWSERLNVQAPPAIFVFNREGRRAAKFYSSEKEYKDNDVENLVIKLLQAQP